MILQGIFLLEFIYGSDVITYLTRLYLIVWSILAQINYSKNSSHYFILLRLYLIDKL